MKSSLFYAIILILCVGFRPADQFQSVYQHGRFLILYSTVGEHALPEAKHIDNNRNGTPDFVEDIALQFHAADKLYEEVFGLRHPLKSPRYKRERVEFIKISMKNGMDYSGVAFDGISTYKYHDVLSKVDDYRNVKTLAVHISNGISFDNHTPAHELMHLYQNGYTLFKTRWYTEGMARWAESSLAEGTGEVGAIPTNEKERQEQVFDRTYRASLFWNALAKHTDQANGKLEISGELAKMTYLNGTPIIEDHYFYGAKFLKTVLEKLDQEDDLVSEKEGLKSYFWEESRQKSTDNNEHIWQAIEEACEQLGVPYRIN